MIRAVVILHSHQPTTPASTDSNATILPSPTIPPKPAAMLRLAPPVLTVDAVVGTLPVFLEPAPGVAPPVDVPVGLGLVNKVKAWPRVGRGELGSTSQTPAVGAGQGGGVRVDAEAE